MAYDEIDAVYYFGDEQKGFWTQTYDSILAAIDAALADFAIVSDKSNTIDQELTDKLTVTGGPEFAAVGQLAYRQTLAATKLTWNDKEKTMWNFLKVCACTITNPNLRARKFQPTVTCPRWMSSTPPALPCCIATLSC